MTSPCDHVTTLDCHMLILSLLVFFICMSPIDRYRRTDRQTDRLRIERQDVERKEPTFNNIQQFAIHFLHLSR